MGPALQRSAWLRRALAPALGLLCGCSPRLFVGRGEIVAVAPCEPGEVSPYRLPSAISAGDLDADGRPELVLVGDAPGLEAAFASARVLWWDDGEACLSRPYAAWEEASPHIRAGLDLGLAHDRARLAALFGVDVVDVDADGEADLLIRNAATDELAVVYGTGERVTPFAAPMMVRVAAATDGEDLRARADAPCTLLGPGWALVAGASQRPDLLVGREGRCFESAYRFAAEGSRRFGPGRPIGGPPQAMPLRAPRRTQGLLFPDSSGLDSVAVVDGKLALTESLPVSDSAWSQRRLRVRQPFAAELAVLVDLGERLPSRYVDAATYRVVIAGDEGIAILRDDRERARWRWTIFELGAEAKRTGGGAS